MNGDGSAEIQQAPVAVAEKPQEAELQHVNSEKPLEHQRRRFTRLRDTIQRIRDRGIYYPPEEEITPQSIVSAQEADTQVSETLLQQTEEPEKEEEIKVISPAIDLLNKIVVFTRGQSWYGDEAKDSWEKLPTLKDSESVPYIVLALLREGGMMHGQYNLNKRDIELHKYLTSLDEQTLTEVKKQNIPGFSKIVDIINKLENFGEGSGNFERFEDEIKLAGYEYASHFLDSGEESAQILSAELIYADESVDFTAIADKILSNNPSLTAMTRLVFLMESRITNFGDINSLRYLLNHTDIPNRLVSSLQSSRSFDLLTDEILSELPEKEKNLWTTIRNTNEDGIRNFLYENRDKAEEFTSGGRITAKCIEEYYAKHIYVGNIHKIREILTEDLLGTFSENERKFWSYLISKENILLQEFIFTHRREFEDLVVNGRETSLFTSTLVRENPKLFMKVATKDQWKEVIGEEAIETFLNALPTAPFDERRNAFTHNQFDRTSGFLAVLADNENIQFEFNQQEFQVLTEFVSSFGLARSPQVYRIYKSLYRFEKGLINELPEDIKSSGINDKEDFLARIKKLNQSLYSEIPYTVFSLSPVEMDLLSLATGHSTTSWTRIPIERILSDFQQGFEKGEIGLVPEAYRPEIIDISKVKIEFNSEAIEKDFQILRDEILDSIEQKDSIDGLREAMGEILQAKIAELTEGIGKDEKRDRFIQQDIERFNTYLDSFKNIDSIDSFVVSILNMNFGKTERPKIDSIMRQLVFRKIFNSNISPEVINDIQNRLEGNISPESLLSIINLVDHVAKAHVLNMEKNNEDGYWQPEAFEKIKASKQGRKLGEIFDPYARNIRDAINNFQSTEVGGTDRVRIIPDRGLIGEMAGYLGNACYTKEYPLLQRYPNLVPYKFVIGEGTDASFLGSVLIFEVQDAQGNPSLLVRAFNMPKEGTINTPEFVERFLDIMAKVAKERGVTQVLVPGSHGTISNYQITSHHVAERYAYQKEPISLKERFAFNGYDLTNGTYLARKAA